MGHHVGYRDHHDRDQASTHLTIRESLVGVTGLEPGTSTVSWWRSNQLSYTPESPSSLPLPRGKVTNLER